MRLSRFALALALAALPATLLAELTVEQRLEDFDFFWESYKGGYVFFQLKKQDHGVDWDQIRDGFRARVENSETDKELYRVITEAQVALRDGHAYNGVFQKIRETEAIRFQRIQFELAEEQKIAVARVVDGTPFAAAGIARGDELIAIGGKTVRQLAEQRRPIMAASSPSQFRNSFASQLYIHHPLLPDPEGDTTTLTFRKASGETVEVTSPWNLAPPTGKDPDPEPQGPAAPMAMATEATPPETVRLSDAEKKAVAGPLPFDVRVFEDLGIGYIGLSTWMKTEDPFQQMEQVMKAVKDTQGLVIDMRQNGGGVGTWGVLFANYFLPDADDERKGANDSWMERKLSKTVFRALIPNLTEEQLEELFTTPEHMHYVLTQGFGMEITVEEVEERYFENGRFRPFDMRMLLNDRTNNVPTYTKPVYVLTDGGSYSTTDIFVTILDEFDRITKVGEPNGAGSGSPLPFTLPNSGLQVYVPHARAYPPHGSMIEGRPRSLDIPVSPQLSDLAEGKDTALTAAVRALWEELNPQIFMLETLMEFDLGAGTQVFSAPAKPFEWGDIPTPDWALDAKVKAGQLEGLRLR